MVKKAFIFFLMSYFLARNTNNYLLANESFDALYEVNPTLAELAELEYDENSVHTLRGSLSKVMEPGETSHGEAIKMLPDAYRFAGRVIEKTFNDIQREHPAMTNGALAAGAAAASSGASAASQALIWGAATALGTHNPGPEKPLTLDSTDKGK